MATGLAAIFLATGFFTTGFFATDAGLAVTFLATGFATAFFTAFFVAGLAAGLVMAGFFTIAFFATALVPDFGGRAGSDFALLAAALCDRAGAFPLVDLAEVELRVVFAIFLHRFCRSGRVL